VSYQGNVDYMPTQTVDEVAEYTDMQGQASAMNHGAANRGSWLNSPTKSLVALWFFVLLTYWLVAYFFRRYLA
jgi:hypothetical protein